ncbi:MAG: UDP-N-acetylglucosamine 1-carboxyvinyltransferase [Oscillospiraceae bacterium]|jgi:UDP-N-acetylglucosamine 1-carboxyvinyltransferase|nr:UDP-N-acetylglucosamine 1-carboxyvinyltransferase [Oscillospiraceae bacterium]
MEILRVTGGTQLSGSVRIHGAKNSVLPIMAASLLVRGTTVIHNCPKLSDVQVTIRILEHLGCKVRREGSDVIIDAATLKRFDIPDGLMREMRSSVVFLGAILARCEKAEISSPGGCELGPRPINLHLEALAKFGANIRDEGGNLTCSVCDKLRSCEIHFPTPSVGATENTLLAASRCEGTTTIINPAREPEIADLAEFLGKLGAKISGVGSGVISVCGIPSAGASYIEHSIIPDRIVCATYMSAVAAAGGDAVLESVYPGHVAPITEALRQMGVDISLSDSSIRVVSRVHKGAFLKSAKPIETAPYPGFPTDAQAPLMAACLKAEGNTVFVENIFENRYRHCEELRRLGASIKTEGKTAIVSGVRKLKGASLQSTDLRGGASLVVAALSAAGVSNVSQLQHIDRGYESIERDLTQLGAKIVRENFSEG